MITIFSRLWMREDMSEVQKRGLCGMICGLAGIFFNLLLSAGKLCAGWLSGSISITADALNNLSDAGSSIVTLVGFKLAGQKPDSGHPFGHGRVEYVSGLVVAAVILFMAMELIRDSVVKILHPQQVQFNGWIAALLAGSILVKCYMAFYNHRIGKKIHSAAILAVATDSLSDAAATLVVLIGALIGFFTDWYVDGYCGVLVGCFIFYAGFGAARDTLNPLLGQPPEREFVERLENIVLNFDENISGVHDLIVHDYGPGQRMVSLHAEVPAESEIRTIHEIIDRLEKRLWEEMGCSVTIHMDPVETANERIDELKKEVLAMLHEVDPVITMHDFHLAEKGSHTELIFDIVVPYHFRLSDEKLKIAIQEKTEVRLGQEYRTMIEVDKDAYLKSNINGGKDHAGK